jgi:hypothetical protein
MINQIADEKEHANAECGHHGALVSQLAALRDKNIACQQ